MGRKPDILNRVCVNCDGNTYFDFSKGYIHYHWFSHDGKWYCSKCHRRLFKDPITRKIENDTYNPRQICFKGKYLRLKENPRKGVCDWCHKRIGDSYIKSRGGEGILKITHLHHIQYHNEDPLKDTVELCVPCHLKESWRSGVFDSRLSKTR